MSWHKKLELLIPDLQEANLISKFVDTFSHNQGSERIINFPEINECKSVAKILIDNLNRMDNVHYLGLCSNCEP